MTKQITRAVAQSSDRFENPKKSARGPRQKFGAQQSQRYQGDSAIYLSSISGSGRHPKFELRIRPSGTPVRLPMSSSAAEGLVVGKVRSEMMVMFLLLVLSVNFLQAEGNAAAEMFTTALRSGDLTTIETLLSSGLDPNLPVRHGQTPLCLALLFNQTRVVELLLARHVDPNAPLDSSRFPATPLQYALEYGNLHAASILIAAGANVDAKGPGGRTALHFAAVGRHLDMLQFLIEKGADLNARDAEGASPLDDAVWRGSLDAVAILLAHGARLNESDTQTGATPISEAAYRGNTSVVQYLLQFHPDLRIPDKRGYSPLDNAIRMGKEDSSLLLLEAEPKERQTPQFFERAMDAAIKKDESLLVEALLRHGAPANDALPSGSTPLDVGASAGAVKVVRVLLENSGDPNISGRNGTTPLEEASLKGFDSIVSMLLDHGALVNRLNSGSGTTALYAAASFGKGDVVKLLLDRGANPTLCGNNRRSPYQAALENGYSEVATQIRNQGGARSCEK
jgi:ankyrin repeat protein